MIAVVQVLKKEVAILDLEDKIDMGLANLKSMVRVIGDSDRKWDGPELSSILDDLVEGATGRLKKMFAKCQSELVETERNFFDEHSD